MNLDMWAEGQVIDEWPQEVVEGLDSTPPSPQESVDDASSGRPIRSRYFWNTFGPPAMVGNGLTSAWRQWRNLPPEWERTRKGFIVRFAAEYGESAIGDSTTFLIGRYLDEDPSFRCCECAGLGRRIRHALVGPVSAHKRDGAMVFSMSNLVGLVAGEGIARTWQPPSTRIHGLAAHVTVDMVAKVGVDLFKEFVVLPGGRISETGTKHCGIAVRNRPDDP